MRRVVAILVGVAALAAIAFAAGSLFLSNEPPGNGGVSVSGEVKVPQSGENEKPTAGETETPLDGGDGKPITEETETPDDHERPEYPAKIESAIGILHDKKRGLRERRGALYLLRHSEYRPRLAADLLRLLGDEEEPAGLRADYVSHLAYLADREADEKRREEIVTAVRAALSDRAAPVRRRAIRVLTDMKDPTALRRAEAAFVNEDETPKVRCEALRAIGEFDARKNIPALRELASNHGDTRIRAAAIVALGVFADEGSRSIFAAAAGSTNHTLRNAGRFALSRLTSTEDAK